MRKILLFFILLILNTRYIETISLNIKDIPYQDIGKKLLITGSFIYLKNKLTLNIANYNPWTVLKKGQEFDIQYIQYLKSPKSGEAYYVSLETAINNQKKYLHTTRSICFYIIDYLYKITDYNSFIFLNLITYPAYERQIPSYKVFAQELIFYSILYYTGQCINIDILSKSYIINIIPKTNLFNFFILFHNIANKVIKQ